MDISFWLNSILLGAALAMDAFSVSAADALSEPDMSLRKRLSIAGTFAVFQCAMPLAGWFCVHTIAELFRSFEKFIPWIAFLLLGFLGGKMLLEGIRNDHSEESVKKLTVPEVLTQGVATSIDALSVGFAIATYTTAMAAGCSVIIGVVTFFICMGGMAIGKKVGLALKGKASILGGIILILIGLQILLK